ncbi:MAG TPA: T9SS type A sorting domain-containing protein [Flavobacteriales bacterium]|nr:T9SS type A sorting domain-containing protein [Flavobacteriales bacterium]
MREVLFSCLLGIPFCAQALSVNHTTLPSTCGACNGSIQAYVVGGTGPYTYLWSPAPPNGQGTAQVSGLCAGTFSLEVWDSMGENVTVTIDVPALPGLNVNAALAASWVIETCAGQCTGQLFLNENLLGGQVPYTTSTSPVMPINALCGDTPFDLAVTDANGCTATITTMVPEYDAPSLLYTEVNGPCGGTPTSVVAYFDVLPTNMYMTTMGGAPMPVTIVNGGVAITGGMPGVYSLIDMGFPPCAMNYYTVVYPATVTDCATVSGDLFVDVNGDCANSSGDFGLANRTVTIDPGFTTLTNAAGHYQRQLPDGTYDLNVSDPVYTQVCPVASPVNFTVDQVTPATIDIAFAPGPDPDIAISCAFNAAVVGFGQELWITVTNNSGVASGPVTITLDHDPVLSYCYAWICIVPPFSMPLVLPYPTSFTTGQLTWDLSAGLLPGQTRLLSARLCVPPDIALLGTDLSYTATATTLLNDADPSNNTCSHTETVVGSYDPNDKQARTSSGSASEWSIANDSLITYTIRFQNIGTAPAVNVVLVDSIATGLDLASLRILGASHTFSASLEGRVLRFTFDHIMLPDSSSNEPRSHGFAQFSIRPVAMAPGSSVANFADIYFDFNPPVRTNTSVVTAPLITGLVANASPAFAVMPNPGTNHFTLSLPPGPHTITLFDATGRMVLQQRTTDARPVINTEALPAGLYRIAVRDEWGERMGATWVKGQ